jgi:pullulanase/glycogen debranching enzyme
MQLDAHEDGSNTGVNRLFMIFNGHYEPQRVELPQLAGELRWHRAIDTSLASGEDFLGAGQEVEIDPADHYLVNPRSTIVLLAQQSKVVEPARAAQRETNATK